MKYLALAILLFSFAHSASAAEQKWSVGAGAGAAFPVFGTDFSKAASASWMGSGFVRNEGMLPTGLELGYDYLNFAKVPTHGDYLGLGLLHTLCQHEGWKMTGLLGLGWAKATQQSRLGVKARVGLEKEIARDWSVGGWVNYHLLTGVSNGPVVHAISPMAGLVYSFGSSPKAAAAPAPAPEAPVVEAPKLQEKLCKNVPAGVPVDALGCPIGKKVEVRLDVEFAKNSSKLTQKYEDEVMKTAAILAAHPEVKGTISGYTDSTGSAKRNKALSQARAESVLAALVKGGVSSSNFTAKGFGAENPVASNKTAAGRAENRRVIVSID